MTTKTTDFLAERIAAIMADGKPRVTEDILNRLNHEGRNGFARRVRYAVDVRAVELAIGELVRRGVLGIVARKVNHEGQSIYRHVAAHVVPSRPEHFASGV